MSQLKEPPKANLTMAVMFTENTLYEEIKEKLETIYGPADIISPVYGFSEISPYYDPEMGGNIKKIIISFSSLIERDRLAEIKLGAMGLENQYMSDGKRQVNIDPGLVTRENFVLSTGKNFSHRIYLGKGVFAEITLLFTREGGIRELPWTYQDYLREPARSFLLAVREKIKEKLKKEH